MTRTNGATRCIPGTQRSRDPLPSLAEVRTALRSARRSCRGAAHAFCARLLRSPPRSRRSRGAEHAFAVPPAPPPPLLARAGAGVDAAGHPRAGPGRRRDLSAPAPAPALGGVHSTPRHRAHVKIECRIRYPIPRMAGLAQSSLKPKGPAAGSPRLPRLARLLRQPRRRPARAPRSLLHARRTREGEREPWRKGRIP
jgi:hypothetical protein